MKRLLFPALAMLLFAGCAATRTQAPVAIYDFGLQRDETNVGVISSQPRLPGRLSVGVTSPIWLDSPAIQYRLAYHDPARSYVYANNRWAAAPGTLLAQRIKSRIAAVSNDGVLSPADRVPASYALQLELEEFAQVFDTTDQSRGLVKMRASLIGRSTRSLLAQRSFSMQQAAPTANAAGAVHALTGASNKLIDDLINWLGENLREETNGGER